MYTFKVLVQFCLLMVGFWVVLIFFMPLYIPQLSSVNAYIVFIFNFEILKR